jgi:uncharacterized membrane protein
MSVEKAVRSRPPAWEDPRLRNQAIRALIEAGIGFGILAALSRKRPRASTWLGVLAGAFGASRVQTALEALAPRLEFEGSILIDAPLELIRAQLADIKLWPRFMSGIESVTPNPDGTLAWQGRPLLTLRRPLKWNTEILHHSREEGIHWRSVPGERIRMEGSLLAESFSELRTRVHAYLRLDTPFHPASTAIGTGFSRLFGTRPLQVFEQDLGKMQALFTVPVVTESAPLPGLHSPERKSA